MLQLPATTRRNGVSGCTPSLDQFPPYGTEYVFVNHIITPAPIASLRIKPSRFPYPFTLSSSANLLTAEMTLIADDGYGATTNNPVSHLQGDLVQIPTRYFALDDGSITFEFVWNRIWVNRHGWYRFKVDFFYTITHQDGTTENVQVASAWTAEPFRVVTLPAQYY
ncbi:hypothetical protein VTJ04DRAFT_6829 [Mycothermus thermophilus]|uniref:uncharacterized protein n=1 Tax=Humicola insolens TaxID=85995 RepID=UPI003743F6B6